MRDSELVAWALVGCGLLTWFVLLANDSLHITWPYDCIAIVQSEDNKTVSQPIDTTKASCHLERHGDTLVVYPIRRGSK